MKQEKYLFIDRDGTLIVEPEDQQIDTIEKLAFMPGVFDALTQLRDAGYQFIMVSNQDGLGTDSFPLNLFKSQGIVFEDVRICPHLSSDQCRCRKPEPGLVIDYFIEQKVNLNESYVIGDRETDLALAERLKLKGLQIGSQETKTWRDITRLIVDKPRRASITRTTNETDIRVSIDLDKEGEIDITSGIGFFDHMLEQIIKHAGISATIKIKGDLEIDDHHTIEDTALALGTAINQALGDKRGIERYGFLLPMDEARALIAIDLSGRSFCQFNANFTRESVGGLSTEMIKHFFGSLASGLKATLHINILGENTHHMAEAAFKGMGRALKQAIHRNSRSIPSTKGVLC